ELSYKLDELAKKHPLLPDTQLLQDNKLNFKGNNTIAMPLIADEDKRDGKILAVIH
ncbi:18155_t:CDS:2, partial [Gigaspora rosea]